MKGSLVAEEETSPEETEVPDPTVEVESDIDDIAAQAEKPDAVSKAIKAEREAAKDARRRAEEAEAKVKEYEDAQKSEQQKLEEAAVAAKEEADALRKQITDLEVARLRTEIVTEKNLPLKMAERLKGNTREEIEADADALLEDLGTLPGETPPPGDGGARTPVQPKDLQDEIREAEAAGDYRKAMSLKNKRLLSLGRTA
jgi:chromosome segregation ATPase